MLTALELARYEEIPTQIPAPEKDAIHKRQENILSQLLEKPKDFKIRVLQAPVITVSQRFLE